MRIHYVLLLVARAFFEIARANSVATDSTPSTATLADSLTAGKDDVSVLRCLRTTATADEDDEDGEQSATVHEDVEERISFDFLTSTGAFKSKLTTLLMGMRLDDKKSVEYAFRKYGLMEAKDKLLEHKKFIEWFTKTKKLRPQNFIKEVVATLLRYYSWHDLYNILDAAKKVESTEGVAKRLQNALIKNQPPNLTVWLQKVISLHKEEKLNSIFLRPFLVENNDAELAELLIAIKTHSKDEVKTMVTEALTLLLKEWVENGKDMKDAHTRLKVMRTSNDDPRREAYREFVRLSTEAIIKKWNHEDEAPTAK